MYRQLVAYGYSAVAQSVANATGASSDLMPSSKLSELLQLAKEKSKLGDILFNSESTNTFT